MGPFAQPPPGPRHAAWPPAPPGKKANLALLFGALGVTGLGAPLAVPAVVLGVLARRDIARGLAPSSGAPRAAAGILLGFVGAAMAVVALSVLGEAAVPSPAEAIEPIATAEPVSTLEVVEVTPLRPLAAQLREIGERAGGRTLILQTTLRGSSECEAVARAFGDTRVQGALAGVTLVRVDLLAFERELQALRVETRSAPWFYRFDARLRLLDAIHASEWDENVPERIAPVLRAFAAGRLRARRSPPPAGLAP